MKRKRILFINMPIREHAPPNNVPLGPLSLASYLNKKGHVAEILDLNVPRSLETLYDTLNSTSNNYDIVGLSGLITTLRYQEKVAKIVRELMPESYIISGGGLATDIKNELFEWIPELDGINIGPGNTTIDEIVERKKKIYYGVPPDNLDEFSLDFSLVDIENYIKNPIWGSDAKNSSTTPFSMIRSLNSFSSMGCPFDCNFCDREATGGNRYRTRSAGSLVKEMKYLISEYNIDFLGYIDDNMTLDKRRLKELSNLIQKEDISLRWGAHARLDDIASEEKAKILKETNCIYFGFGGESANKIILRLMNKGKRIVNSPDFLYDGHKFPKIYIDALENCKKYDIHPNLTWIMGYPGETIEQLKDTVAFILFIEDEGYVPKRYNNHSIFVTTAYPNTVLFNTPVVQKKIKKSFDNFKEYVYNLGDATEIISNNEILLNYSAMNDYTFLEVYEYVRDDKLEKILEI